MSKINLIPEVRQQKLKVQQLNATVTSTAVVLAVVVGIVTFSLAGYAGVMATQKASIERDIVTTQDSLDTMKDLEATVLNLELGLKNIKAIIDGNKNWNNLFLVFEKNTPTDIQISNLTMNSGLLSLSMKGKEVRSIDRFLGAFIAAKNDKDENYFLNVSVAGFTKKDTGAVTFESKINVNEAALW